MPVPAARRKLPTHVSVRVHLAGQARLFELEANRSAIDSCNTQVAKRGVFSDNWRRF